MPVRQFDNYPMKYPSENSVGKKLTVKSFIQKQTEKHTSGIPLYPIHTNKEVHKLAKTISIPYGYREVWTAYTSAVLKRILGKKRKK